MSSENVLNDNIYSISTSPYFKSNESIPRIMWNVNLALAPAAVFAAIYFGLPALINMIVGIISAVAFEYLVQKIRKVRITAFDGSAFLTGLLLAMCVPPNLPYYMSAIGSFLAIVVAKHSMGGPRI